MKIPLWLCATIFVGLIFAIFVVFYVTKNNYKYDDVSRFKHEPVKTVYKSVVDSLGYPHIVVNQPGGFAMWFPNTLDKSQPYNSVIIKDEQIPHSPIGLFSPKTGTNHYDCLYSTVIANIPESELQSILSVNKSIFYDRATNELTVRCNSLASNKSIIYAIIQRVLNPVVWNASIAQTIEHQTRSNICNIDGSTNASSDKILDGCLTRQLDLLNNSSSDIQKREQFIQKTYKKIPVAP